jgi:hypothetical protein
MEVVSSVTEQTESLSFATTLNSQRPALIRLDRLLQVRRLLPLAQ